MLIEFDITIDGRPLKVRKGITVMQACLMNQIEIPRFCYHDKLSIAGNCRMCLVEIEKSAKLVASCAMPIYPGMRVFTNTSIVKKAREGVLEFLLLNHPLDCPICDQGGECDLQDQAMVYGSDRNRFFDFKRGVRDKQVGPLIKTIMTRCIHCTRCVRFCTEVAKLPVFGTAGRGTLTEITTYVKLMWMESLLSGNLIDLCPVGALTSKPYAFKARPWELKNVNTIDVFDVLNTEIRVDSNSFEVLRVLPKIQTGVNGEWISDQIRFSVDGLKNQRLLKYLFRSKREDTFQEITEVQALDKVIQVLADTSSVDVVIGDLIGLETISFLKLMEYRYFNKISSSIVSSTNVGLQNTVLSTVDEIEKAKIVVTFGVNLVEEYPLMQARITTADLFHIGGIHKKGLCTQIGLTKKTLLALCNGKLLLSKKLNRLTGLVFTRENVKLSNKYFSKVHCITLPKSSSSLNAMSMGIIGKEASSSYLNSCKKKRQVVFLFNTDEYNQSMYDFSVYFGHHGDKGALHANIVIPIPTFVEKESTYTNICGIKKATAVAISPKQGLMSEVCFLLSALLYKFNSGIFNINKAAYFFAKVVSYGKYSEWRMSTLQKSPLLESTLCGTEVRDSINVFSSNVITRASATLNKCLLLREKSSMQSFNL